MKDIYKNPIFYYILVPAVAGIWPLLVGVVYLPQVQENWDKERDVYNQSQEIIKDILTLDPERLDFSNSNKGSSKFDYARVVDDIASLCKIPASNYNISSRPARTSGGQKSQSAMVILKDVDITSFAEFLSKIQ